MENMSDEQLREMIRAGGEAALGALDVLTKKAKAAGLAEGKAEGLELSLKAVQEAVDLLRNNKRWEAAATLQSVVNFIQVELRSTVTLVESQMGHQQHGQRSPQERPDGPRLAHCEPLREGGRAGGGADHCGVLWPGSPFRRGVPRSGAVDAGVPATARVKVLDTDLYTDLCLTLGLICGMEA